MASKRKSPKRAIPKRKQVEETLQRIEWSLTRRADPKEQNDRRLKISAQSYGDLTEFNRSRLILDSVGRNMLTDIVGEYLDLLDTSAAVYEKNGDYALGLFTSSWCRFMDLASRRLCGTADNQEALACGKWLCHESCWTKASKVSIESCRPVDIECAGGIRLYAVPIRAGGEIVGSINVGHGDPPRSPDKQQALAATYGVSVEELRRHAEAYETRPPYIIELAKHKLQASARLIGEIIERKAAEQALRESEARLQAILENVSEGVVAADLDANLVHWNPAAIRMHGFATLEECRRRLPEFADIFELATLDGTVLPVDEWPLSRILRGETLRDLEIRIRRRHGDWERVFRYGGSLVRDASGQPMMAVVTVSDITDRKRAEEALRESREDLSRAQAIGQIGSWRLDVGRNVLSWSDENHRIFGIPKGTPMTYETFLGTVHPDDRRYVDTQWKAGLAGEPYDIEHRIVVSGQVKWVREKAYLEFDDGGELRGGFGITQDITERKAGEENLLRAKEEWERTFESVPDLIAILDPEHRIVRVNRAMAERLGLSAEACIGRFCYEAVHRLNRPPPFCPHTCTLADGALHSAEVHEDSLGGDFLVSTTPLVDADGQMIGTVHVARDITERKAHEEALRKAHDRAVWLARFPEENPNPVVRVAADGTVLYANPPARELPGWSVEVGQPLQPALLALVREALVEGRERQQEIPLGRRFYEVTVAPFPQEGYANLYAEDSTDRKRAEDALRRSRDVLEQRVAQRTEELTDTVEQLRAEAARRELAEDALRRSNEDLRRRAAQLARLASELTTAEQKERQRLAEVLHDDLQQVLVGTKYHLELAANWAGGDRRILQMVEQAGVLLAEAVQKARSLSQELSPPMLRQQGLVSGLEWLARQVKEKHGLAVAVAWEGAVEPVSEAVAIFVYKAAQEMLFNVVKHAGVCEAEVRVRRTDDHLEVSIADRGKGFDPASVAPGAEIRTFGLFSIRERAGLLGGRLDIQSAPGCGSTFVLYIPDRGELPAEQEPPAEGARPAVPRAEAARLDAAKAQGAVLRVLLVDDHRVMRQGLAMLLAEEPDLAVVGEADNGEQAVQRVAECRPDVVVMDVSMPVMDGIEATQIIKREWPEVRVVGLSMFDEAELARDMLEAGADAYLPKAGPPQDLLAAIRRRTA
jgi:PAS domain S-box-containing protein